MVAVKMRDENRRHAVGVEPEPLHPDERRRAAVDEELLASPGHVIARLQPAAGAERVARADDRKLHVRLAESSSVAILRHS